jgi:predicted DNA-binding protein
LPVYLERQVQERLAALASAKGVELSTLINELLKKDIELIEIGR